VIFVVSHRDVVFIVSKLIAMVVLPAALLVELAVLGLLLHRWRIGRVARVVGVAGLAACLVLPVGTWAIRPLEDRFPQVREPPAKVDGIVVLGGAIDDLTSEDRGTPVLNGAANRLTTFVALARRYPQARLVFTGGSGDIEQGITDEARFARVLLAGLGLPEDRVVFESQSRTTAENAEATKALVQPKPGEVWVLVTSAAHMPRSVGVFRKAGWDVLPWPVGYRSRDRIGGFAPSLGEKLAVLDSAAHEWEGLAAYWVTGRMSTVWPGP
jgi:uncharacterized SAM-binding protein YcdF (DUF218 family)